jgi:iron complex outermembrane recepter protein
VDAGVVGSHAAGISRRILNANIEHQLAKGWSVDAAANYSGKRWADTANSFKTPAVTLISIGARRKFALANRPAEFRVLASNLTGVKGYWAAPSGVFSPIAPRTVRAMVTVTFGGAT